MFFRKCIVYGGQLQWEMGEGGGEVRVCYVEMGRGVRSWLGYYYLVILQVFVFDIRDLLRIVCFYRFFFFFRGLKGGRIVFKVKVQGFGLGVLDLRGKDKEGGFGFQCVIILSLGGYKMGIMSIRVIYRGGGVGRDVEEGYFIFGVIRKREMFWD